MTNLQSRVQKLEAHKAQKQYANGGIPPMLHLRGSQVEAEAMKGRLVNHIRQSGRFDPILEPITVYRRGGDPCSPEELESCEARNMAQIDAIIKGETV